MVTGKQNSHDMTEHRQTPSNFYLLFCSTFIYRDDFGWDGRGTGEWGVVILYKTLIQNLLASSRAISLCCVCLFIVAEIERSKS